MYKEREAKSLNQRIEKFVKLGEDKYGVGTYDYSMAEEEYTNNRTRVHLICNNCESEPFLVYPFAHTFNGDNQKGTCKNCYVPKETIQETRWDPNRQERAIELRESLTKRHKGKYTYPHIKKEYKNEKSKITVICKKCKLEFERVVSGLKNKDRYGGCPDCNKEVMAETIRQKNRIRGSRNKKNAHLPKPYGCIYMIKNTADDKFYIGYTTMSAKKRFKAHKDDSSRLDRGNKKAKSYLHSAMLKHGFEHFDLQILKEFTNVSPIELGEVEMKYIADMKPQYNVSPGGELANYGKVS